MAAQGSLFDLERSAPECPFCFVPRRAPRIVGMGDSFAYECRDCGKRFSVDGTQAPLFDLLTLGD